MTEHGDEHPDEHGDDYTDLLTATRALSESVVALRRHVQLSQRTTRRLTVVTVLVTVLALFALGGVIVSVNLYGKLQANAKTNCENNNESRLANQVLWTKVIDLSRVGDDMSEPETEILDTYQEWIDRLYAPRDCDDLSREYPIPPPPTIPAAP